MPQPAEILALSDDLRSFTQRAWQRLEDDIDAIIDTWPEASRDARRRRLQDLQTSIGKLTSTTDELALALATTGVHTAYTLGAEAAALGGQYTAVDVEALGALAKDLYDDVLAATKGVSSSGKLLIRTLAREHVGDRLTGGQTAADAARALRRELEAKQIRAVTYKDGSRRGLADYTDMIARTKTAQAFNAGIINSAVKAEVRYLEVFDGFGCGWTSHGDVDSANGTIRTVEECARQTLSHPRCQRAFGPRPDVVSARDAQEATSSQTAAQAEDQRQVAIARQARVEARAKRLAARQRKLRERTAA